MNDTNLIDTCQAHLPVQYASNIEFIARSDTGVLTASEPQVNVKPFTLTLQETRSIHDFMNIPKIEFIS